MHRIIFWIINVFCNVPPPDPILDRRYYATQRAYDQSQLAWYDWRGLRRIKFRDWYADRYMRS